MVRHQQLSQHKSQGEVDQWTTRAKLHWLLRQKHQAEGSHGTVSAGFTMIELLVVMIIVGVLFGIAAPGWLGFMNRQRVNGTNTEVLQVMREAQTLSISKRKSYRLDFDPDEPVISLYSADAADTAPPIKTYRVGNQDGGSAEMTLETFPAAAGNSLIFNFDGSVKGDAATVTTNTDGSVYKVVVSLPASSKLQSCVIVETLIGALSEAKGDRCNANYNG